MVDLDGDGDLDLVFTQPGGSAGVAWQMGDGTWLKQPNVLTPETPPGNVLGHVPADVDGDGDVDVLVLRTGTPALLRNDGGTFTDVSDTQLPGVVVPGPSGSAGDVDADGDVDFYLGGYLQGTTFPWHRCAANALLIGDGTGRFTDRAAALGVDDEGCALATAMVDIDDDGDLDLVTVNDFAMFVGPSRIYRNDGPDDATGELRFTALPGGLSTPVYGMGVAFDDLNSDGRLDLMMSSIGRPAAMVQDELGGFVDATESLGLAVRHGRTGLQVTWGLAFEDYDHDGHLDAIASGGHIPAAIFLESAPNASNVVWAGRSDGGFDADPAGWVLPEGGQYVGRGLSRGDLDGDGRTDLVIAHSGLRVSVFRNGSPGRPTLRVRPRPRYTATADGTRVRVSCAGEVRTRQVVTGGVFGGAHAPETTVSYPTTSCPLGTPLDVWIRYPSGFTERLTALAGDDVNPQEPEWLTVVASGQGWLVKAAPTGPDGTLLTSDVVIAGGSGDTTFVDSQFTAPLPPTDVALSLVVSGQRWPLTRRVNGGPAAARFELVPAQPRAARPVTYRVVLPPGSSDVVEFIDVDGVPYAAQTLAGGVAQISFPDAGGVGIRSLKAVAAGEVIAGLSVDVAPTVSLARTRVTIEAASVIGLLGKAKVRIEPCDEAGRCELDPSLVEFRVSGANVAATTQALTGAIEANVDVAGHAGEQFDVVVAGTTVASVTLHQSLSGPEMAALVSSATSRCAFGQGVAWADGFDRVTFLFDFRASDGQRLPIPAYWLDFPASGVSYLPGSVTVANYYGTAAFTVVPEVGAATVGTVSPRVYGVPVGVTCAVPIVAPPAPAFDANASALTVVPAQLTPGQTAGVQFVPRTASGRLVGSATGALVTTTLGSLTGPLAYDGKGAYTTVVKHVGDVGTATVAGRVDGLGAPEWTSSSLELLSESEPPGDADVVEPPPDVASIDVSEPADVDVPMGLDVAAEDAEGDSSTTSDVDEPADIETTELSAPDSEAPDSEAPDSEAPESEAPDSTLEDASPPAQDVSSEDTAVDDDTGHVPGDVDDGDASSIPGVEQPSSPTADANPSTDLQLEPQGAGEGGAPATGTVGDGGCSMRSARTRWGNGPVTVLLLGVIWLYSWAQLARKRGSPTVRKRARRLD